MVVKKKKKKKKGKIIVFQHVQWTSYIRPFSSLIAWYFKRVN